MRVRQPILLLAVTFTGCVHRAGQDRTLEDAPAWTTSAGRDEARLQMASSMLELGRPQEALAVLAGARGESHDELAFDLLLARAYLALGMAAEAGAILEPWDARRQAEPELYRLLGLTRADLQRPDEAEAAFRRAVQLDPDDYDTQNNLGFLLLVRGRPEEAVPVLRRALELSPDEPRARTNLGFALAAQGLDREALDVFRAIQPEALALTNMGLACERRGAPEEALTWYRRALDIAPTQIAAAEAITRLAPSREPGSAPPPDHEVQP